MHKEWSNSHFIDIPVWWRFADLCGLDSLDKVSQERKKGGKGRMFALFSAVLLLREAVVPREVG